MAKLKQCSEHSQQYGTFVSNCVSYAIMCVHICMCICVYNVYACICMQVQVCIYKRTHVVCMYACTHTCMCTVYMAKLITGKFEVIMPEFT